MSGEQRSQGEKDAEIKDVEIKDAAGKDVEKQEVPLESLSDTTLEKVKKIRVPDIDGSVVLVYAALSTMFVVGCVSINSCPINIMIPIYLIVAGAASILTKLLINTTNACLFNVVILLVLFDLAWLATGSYFVYKEFQPNYDPMRGPYCSRIAYLLSFWMITIQYTLLSLFILLSLCHLLMRGDFK